MSSQQVGFQCHLPASPFFSTTDSTPLSPYRITIPSSASPSSSISISLSRPRSMREAVPLRHEEGRLQEEKEEEEEEDPVSFVSLQSICSEDQFDRVLADAQQRHEALLVVWMASWCRKCIYLKPKLEKWAVDYYPRLQFYSIDVNTVSHKLVVRAGVTKMPTIQLWKDKKKQGEVIGGHKAYLVINEIQEMIENA